MPSEEVEKMPEFRERLGRQMQEQWATSIEIWIMACNRKVIEGLDYNEELEQLSNAMNRFREWSDYRLSNLPEVTNG